jgi:hypothetical protein
MPRPQHYSPAINRFIVSALYHESKAKGVPMTKLTNELLQKALAGSDGWKKALQAMLLQEEPPKYTTK